MAEPVHRLGVIVGSGRPKQAQTFRLVHCYAAPVQQCGGECGDGIGVAGVGSLAEPAYGLGIVAGDAETGGIHAAQAEHDGGIALVGLPAQRLQEITAVVADAP